MSIRSKFLTTALVFVIGFAVFGYLWTWFASEARLQLAVLASGTSILGAVFLLVFRILVGGRLEAITEHFKNAAAQPDGSPLSPVAVTGNDEISVLASSFNSLAARLQRVQASLERRVQQRTAKLDAEIAERKRAEETLRSSEERFRGFAMASGYGFAISELNGQLVFANAATLRILEEDREEDFTRKTFKHYYAPEESQRVSQEIMPVVREKGQWVGEIPLVSARGNSVPTEQNFFLIRDEHGNPRMVGNIITDIRERKQAEALEKICQATQAANRAKSQFLANMSHEIRTPLNAILGLTEVLLKGGQDLGEEERRDYLETVHSSGRHLLELINDILDLSKIEAGRMQVEKVRCTPYAILAGVLSVLRVRAQEKGLSLSCQWPEGIPSSIETDPTRLQQLLVNLVGNALKFTEKGEVRIVARLSAAGPQRRMAFDVVDTGIGIEPDKLESIFDAFVQADNSVTRRFGGTGLGLAISRRIAAALGGDLTVHSQLGVGSMFTATIDPGSLEGVEILTAPPADGPESASAHAPAAQNTLPPNSKILLVEDNSTNRKLIKLVLTRAGAQVMMAENGQIGVDLATRQPFDLILMDMQMPVMDGYEATRRLRDSGNTSPIVALTAHAMTGDRQKCLDAGCDDFASKPIDGQKLLATVAHWLARAGASRPATPGTPDAAATDDAEESRQSEPPAASLGDGRR